jgi:uncharacterized protein (DUF1697 family)
MTRYAAFLRGMNLGGRRITNPDLCAAFAALGLRDATAYQASGNVVFDTRAQKTGALEKKIEKGLETELGYEVATMVRPLDQVAQLAVPPFEAALQARAGKPQIMILQKAPSAATRDAVMAFDAVDDRLGFAHGALYWLPAGKITDSTLDLRAIQNLVGVNTMRTTGTLERLAKKFA